MHTWLSLLIALTCDEGATQLGDCDAVAGRLRALGYDEVEAHVERRGRTLTVLVDRVEPLSMSVSDGPLSPEETRRAALLVDAALRQRLYALSVKAPEPEPPPPPPPPPPKRGFVLASVVLASHARLELGPRAELGMVTDWVYAFAAVSAGAGRVEAPGAGTPWGVGFAFSAGYPWRPYPRLSWLFGVLIGADTAIAAPRSGFSLGVETRLLLGVTPSFVVALWGMVGYRAPLGGGGQFAVGGSIGPGVKFFVE